jgi:hypothetical protein
MKSENKRGQQIWGGVFITLALLLYAVLFVGLATGRPELEKPWQQLNRISLKPALVESVPANRLLSLPATKWVARLVNPPAVCLLLVGAAWFWNGRKRIGAWMYGILAGYFAAASALYFAAVYLARGKQAIPSNYLLTVTLAAAFFLAMAGLFLWRAGMLARQAKALETGAGLAAQKPAASAGTSAPVKAQTRPRSVAVCNVLQAGAEARRVWQFDARKSNFRLNHEHAAHAGEPLPAHLIRKSWGSLFQPKLNVAWLPPGTAFLRVERFPQTTLEETRTMVELQLEKLSPIPVTQAVWTLHVLPPSACPPRSDGSAQSGAKADSLQTVVVTIAERKAVEEFLGRLEGQGYMADWLEVPMLDQLQAVSPGEDGAWIYPEPQSGQNTALVAWWCGGVLQSVDYVIVPSGEDRAAVLKDQLVQTAWAGEMEGWLTAPPRWHLVTDADTAAEWQPLLRQGLGQPIEVLAPLPLRELAASTARRTVRFGSAAGLLPAEFASRYRQQFIDRLWMRGLGAVLSVYVVGVVIYMIAAGFLGIQARKAERTLAGTGRSYTNALQTITRYEILKEREELKYAALDCWKSIAEKLPDGVTMDSLRFSDGRKLTIEGTAPASQVNDVIDFCDQLRKTVVRTNQPLFKSAGGEVPNIQGRQAGIVSWNFALELNRVEVE